MGSTTYLDYECYQCHHDHAFYERKWRHDITHFYCPICGTIYDHAPILDRQKKYEHGGYDYKLTKAGSLIWRTHYRRGYGAYRVTYSSGRVFSGRFSHATSAEAVQMFFQQKQNGREIIVERSFVTIWNEQTQQVQIVLGQIPDPFLDWDLGGRYTHDGDFGEFVDSSEILGGEIPF